jgi:hypothetical protein
VKTHTIYLKDIKYTDPNTGDVRLCKNPKVTWTNVENECIEINCVYDYGKQADGSVSSIIKVQVPDSCDITENCLSFIIQCEDCGECPPQLFNACLCESNADCDLCENCVDGFCIDKPCPELCDPATGDCVPCIDDSSCPCDQICTPSGCACPPGQKINSLGCCVDCLSSSDCAALGPCAICVGGNCLPRTCPPSQFLNLNTCNCVNCLVDGHCTDPNTCCNPNTGACECCPGFYGNALGDCIPLPDCITNNDCPACFVCNANGDCVPKVCPQGQVCVDDVCYDECNCTNPNCFPGFRCVQVPGRRDLCICREKDPAKLEDQCNSQKCPNGASDCGVGCGCNEFGDCVPCTISNCTNCGNIQGCDCINSTDCDDLGCKGDCVDGYAKNQCVGANCGCWQGSCVHCESVSCSALNTDCPVGCFCDVANGLCKASPCNNVSCSSPDECGPGCGCNNEGKCVPCDYLNCSNFTNTSLCEQVNGCNCNNIGQCVDDNAPCQDDLTLERQGNDCALEGKLQSTSCCGCPEMKNRTTVSYTAVGGNLISLGINTELLYRNVLINAAPNLPQDIQYLNSAGVLFTITADLVYVRTNNTGTTTIPFSDVDLKVTKNVAITAGNASASQTITNADVLATPLNNLGLTLLQPNAVQQIGSNFYKLVGVKVSINSAQGNQHSVQMQNQCRYRLDNVVIYNVHNFNSQSITSSTRTNIMRSLVACSLPIFTLSKGNTATTINTVIDRRYAPKIGSNYILSYNELQGVEYGRFYSLNSDCGCTDKVFYNCQGTSKFVATPLVFCKTNNSAFNTLAYSNCGKTITFTENLTVNCSVYTANGVNKPAYRIIINNTQVINVSLPAGTSNVLVASGTSYQATECITSIRFEHVLDECNECTFLVNKVCEDLSIIYAELEEDCISGGEVNIKFSVNNPSADAFIALYNASNLNTPIFSINNQVLTSGIITIPTGLILNSGVNYILEVEDNVTGCNDTKVVTINPGQCCTCDTTGLTILSCNTINPSSNPLISINQDPCGVFYSKVWQISTDGVNFINSALTYTGNSANYLNIVGNNSSFRYIRVRYTNAQNPLCAVQFSNVLDVEPCLPVVPPPPVCDICDYQAFVLNNRVISITYETPQGDVTSVSGTSTFGYCDNGLVVGNVSQFISEFLNLLNATGIECSNNASLSLACGQFDANQYDPNSCTFGGLTPVTVQVLNSSVRLVSVKTFNSNGQLCDVPVVKFCGSGQ